MNCEVESVKPRATPKKTWSELWKKSNPTNRGGTLVNGEG